MSKKIISFLAIMCLFVTMYSPINVQAAQSSINSKTVITQDNIYQVLEYLGLDSSTFKKTDGVVYNAYQTVGDLEKYIKDIKKKYSNKTIYDNDKNTTIINNDTNQTTIINKKSTIASPVALNSFISSVSTLSTSPTYGTESCQYTINGDAWNIVVTTPGSYRSSYWSGTVEQTYHSPIWTGASIPSAYLTTNSIIPAYMIDSQTGYSTYTSTTITTHINVKVGVYVGVNKWGLVEVTHQDIVGAHDFSVYNYVN